MIELYPVVKEQDTELKGKIKELLKNKANHTWDTLMLPLEEMSDTLSKLWAPFGHLHAVAETEDLREAYKRVLPLLTEYHTDYLQNIELFQAIQSLKESAEYSRLNTAQRKIIDNDLRDFKLTGVHLAADQKARFAALQKELSLACTTFSEHLLDATHHWHYHTTDLNELKGLSEQTLTLLKENAAHLHKTGWVITLDHPCYSAVMKYANNRQLRRTLYEAYVTRASDQGPDAGKFDNTAIMSDILKLRHELSFLLDFKNYAELSLATKMVSQPQQVLTFLNDLVTVANL